ncbi:hypothetical protein ABT340_39545 [Streptosporangium sp. NPDC000239]|uniref:hypothetical protein n=1 Tax=Streptosporangium sp. NPDC000239 TaxID=3154248 RepID=UPI003332D992
MSTVPPRPPLVWYGSRLAWLQVWRRGEVHWMALVFYAENDGNRPYVVERWATADEITKIDGENYTRVPRVISPPAT